MSDEKDFEAADEAHRDVDAEAAAEADFLGMLSKRKH